MSLDLFITSLVLRKMLKAFTKVKFKTRLNLLVIIFLIKKYIYLLIWVFSSHFVTGTIAISLCNQIFPEFSIISQSKTVLHIIYYNQHFSQHRKVNIHSGFDRSHPVFVLTLISSAGI